MRSRAAATAARASGSSQDAYAAAQKLTARHATAAVLRARAGPTARRTTGGVAWAGAGPAGSDRSCRAARVVLALGIVLSLHRRASGWRVQPRGAGGRT